MVFSSLVFLFRFLPLTLLTYYIVPKRFRNLVLFAASIIFYAWGEPVYVVLILFSTLVDYTTGQIAGYYRQQNQMGRARMAVAASASINLALLGFFKYADFFLETVNTVFSLEIPPLSLALPIGISFYTFQTMSYTIDVYRGDAKVQKNLITFGAYVSLFPQLIAGPIVRYKDIAEQLVSRSETKEKFFNGIVRFTVGLGKKVLIANQIGMVWSEAAARDAMHITTAGAWIGSTAFALQMYFDFSGYSDMASGLGQMFGFTFPENFDHPYESLSTTEFWARWHKTLGTWFREYVYIPLGGNRKGLARQVVNLAVVWFLTGLWHGARWNYVVWGMFYGGLVVLEKFFLLRVLNKLPHILRHIYLVVTAVIAAAIFTCPDVQNAKAYLQALFFHGSAGYVSGQDLYMMCSNAGIFLIAVVGSTSLVKRVAMMCLSGKTERDVRVHGLACILYVAAVFTACLAMLVNSSYNPFLYFRF